MKLEYKFRKTEKLGWPLIDLSKEKASQNLKRWEIDILKSIMHLTGTISFETIQHEVNRCIGDKLSESEICLAIGALLADKYLRLAD